MISRNALARCCASALLLCGCASREAICDLPKDAKGSGSAIVSLTRSGLSAGYAIELRLRGRDNAHKSTVRVTGSVVSNLFLSLDWDCPRIAVPITEPCGRLAVLDLPEGEYEF